MNYRKLKFRSAAACRIAGIDKQRFNEAVAAGHYPCAPQVDRGASRLFLEDDLIALAIYARLVAVCELSPRQAGHLACCVRSALGKAEDGVLTNQVSVNRTINGHEYSVSGNFSDERHLQTPRLFTQVFQIADVRKIVRREMEEEGLVRGEDE